MFKIGKKFHLLFPALAYPYNRGDVARLQRCEAGPRIEKAQILTRCHHLGKLKRLDRSGPL